ncbi:MAG: M48 family metallopeptidase [Pseudohongiellaceae bacterium]
MSKAELRAPTFPFSFELNRMRRKTLVVYVKSGKVEVRSPLKTPMWWINTFLQEMTPWILEQLSAQQAKLRERLVIADNREVPFLGQPRLIQVVISERQQVLLKGDKLYLHVQARNRDKLEKLFHAWLLEQAREYMATQTIKYARELGVDKKLKEVVFRKTRTKWGHCCEDGTIQYNWLAMMAPREVVNYLIAHETSHLRHLDHSAKFWNTVGSLCPDYKDLRNWLTRNGHRFWTAPGY